MKEKFVCVRKADVNLEDEYYLCEVASTFKIFNFKNQKDLDKFISWLKKTECDYLIS